MNAKKHVPKGQKKKKCQKHWRRSIRGNLFFPLKLGPFPSWKWHENSKVTIQYTVIEHLVYANDSTNM